MAGLGLLLGGLSGAGRGLAQSAEFDQKVAAEQQLAEQRAKLEEERALRIDEARRERERAGQLKMGQDIGAETSRLQNEQDAAAINAKYGSTATAEDVAALRNNPEARKAYGLLDTGRQGALETRATAAENIGYLEAARETRGQLQTELQNQRQEAQDKNTNRRLDIQEERQKLQDDYNRRRETRLDRLADAQLAFQKARAEKEDTRAQGQAESELRKATAAALNGVTQHIKSLEKEAADPLLAQEQKDIVRQQLGEARAEARRYRESLAGAGLEGSQAPSKPFNPADFPLGGNAAPRQPAGGGRAANPFSENAPQAAPGAQATPAQQAQRGLDLAISQTVRDLTAAQNRGDRTEVARLNDLLQQQQAAKARTF